MADPIYGWTPVQCGDCGRVYTPNAESTPEHPMCPACGSSVYGAPEPSEPATEERDDG